MAGGARKPGGRAGKRKARGRGGAGGLGARGGSRRERPRPGLGPGGRAGAETGPAGAGVPSWAWAWAGAWARAEETGTELVRTEKPCEEAVAASAVDSSTARNGQACTVRSGGESAPLRFYGSAADHVENNNSLVRSQLRLVFFGAPSRAAGFPDRASPGTLYLHTYAPDRARAQGAAKRHPAPRKGLALGNERVHPRLWARERRGEPVWGRIARAPGEALRP